MAADVVQLPGTAPRLLTKRQLAAHWRCSERTVEQRAAGGMPTAGLDRSGRQRYDLAACEAWLTEQKGKPRVDRMTALEREVATLRREVASLRKLIAALERRDQRPRGPGDPPFAA
jgi:hypothetical protein